MSLDDGSLYSEHEVDVIGRGDDDGDVVVIEDVLIKCLDLAVT